MVGRQYVIGNWKMYKMAREAVQYIEKLVPLVERCEANIFLAVPFTAISACFQAAKNANILIGAQNMSDAKEGAFTGEIGSLMLKEAGASFILLGHSERRHVFGESDEFIHRKVIRALQDDLQPILCVGETLAEREAGETEKALKRQIFTALKQIPKEEAPKVILAYEPVWAIGTGKTASAKMAGDAHAFCRACLAEIFGKKIAGSIPILYGGSVKPDNTKELISQEDIDGVLVGGASLDPESFSKIVHHCEKKK
ncbi:MAG: triose-phosphate isomerase [Chlamydiae bacterium RIFCSPHIGHO2_12_FULL_49_9]|nr:MAG: triose-phosphate isomerase [Chlamydiae bacterium RIFCSPHIGHO2_12_FULL_49_9]